MEDWLELRFKIFSLVIFILFGFPCALEDFRTLKINPWNAYFGTLVIGLAAAFFCFEAFVPALISCVAIFAVFLITRFVFKADLGMGDVKFSLFCGMACGNVLWALAGLGVACIATALTFLIAKIKGSPLKKLPFVPFLVAGTTLAMLCRIFIK